MVISQLKRKIFADKKGIGIDDAMPIIIFIFVAAFILVFFKINEKVKSGKSIDDIQRQKDILEGQSILMSYIKAVDNDGKNKADFISKSIVEKNYDGLKQDITEYFSKKIGNQNWYVDVKYSSNNLILPSITNAKYSPQEQYSSMQTAYPVASVYLPISGSNSKPIFIELFFSK